MEESIHGNEHILLTSLGMNAIPTEYQWDGKTATAPLTPLALVQLLDPAEQPNRVVAMVTDGARDKTWPVFEAEICNRLKIKPEAIDIPDGKNATEIREILEKVAQKIPKGAELTLDVTQGFRHFPFIFYALVLYLTSLRSVKIRGAYYGLIEGSPPDEPKPIIDLQPLLELPEWFHAVRMFRDQGTTEPIAQLIQPIVQPIADNLNTEADKLDKQAAERFRCGDMATGGSIRAEEKSKRRKASEVIAPVVSLKKHAFAYESALPLELRKASRLLIDAICTLPAITSPNLPPLAQELTDAIVSVAEESAFEKSHPAKGKKGDWNEWKKKVSLICSELRCQAQMIDLYLKRGQFPLAVGLMREWVVSWAILKSGNHKEVEKWLDRDVRSPYERRLGALGAFARDEAFKDIRTSEQKAFGDFWNQLVNLRNTLHHHGMRYDPLEQPPGYLESVQAFWDQLKAGCIGVPPLGGGKGKLLLSPQGTRPGVLFSALKVAEPGTCLVICSADSASGICKTAKKAGFCGDPDQIILTDPHGGFSEIKTVVEQARSHLLEADEIAANMTGGTTLMGLIIQRLVEEAQKLGRPVRRFALIDRRSPDEQDRDPYVKGDHHWL